MEPWATYNSHRKTNCSTVHTYWWSGAIWCQNQSSHMAHLHLTLSVKKTGSKATQLLTSRLQLRRQKEHVKRGGCNIDKHNIINSSIFIRFTAARANKQHVTTQTLQLWGISASLHFTFPVFPFKVSWGWVKDFKKNYKISLAMFIFIDKLKIMLKSFRIGPVLTSSSMWTLK